MDFRYLRIDRAPSPPLLKILRNNIIGTPGHGMLYQHLHVDDKVNKLADPYFVNIVRGGQIAGTCCFCSRATLNGRNSIRSFYVRYFSFQEIFRRKSIHEKKHRSGSIRAEVESLLSGNGLDVLSNEKFFFYAYVDPRNKRSAMLCEEFGFETVRQYTTILFSRIYPKQRSSLPISEVPSSDMVDLLKEYYQDYNTLSFENLEGRKYYILRDERSEIVAGVLANPDAWRAQSLTGKMGKLTLTIFSRLPILRRIMSKDFKFVSFDALYVRPGSEKQLESLLESMLHKFNVNTGICLVDKESPLFKTLERLNLGLANKLSKRVTGNVIFRFSNFSRSEKEHFFTRPAYLSSIDAT